MPTDIAPAYNIVKGLEDSFPIPAAVETVLVGTIDAGSGRYAGLQTEIIGSGSSAIRVPPVARINAVRAQLRFEVLNLRDFLTVSVGDVEETVSITDSSTSITIDVGAATVVQWSARSQDLTWSGDRLIIERPRVVGVGAFTIPALPIALVYAPPVDNLQNKVSYSVARTVGTRVDLSFAQDASTTRLAVTNFDYLNRFLDILSTTASAIEAADPSQKDVADAMRTAASTLKGAIGSSNSSTVSGEQSGFDSAFETSTTWREGLSLSAQDGGPGSGDQVLYLRNARLVWLADSGMVRLALLGQDSVVSDFVRVLRDDLTELKRFDCRRTPLPPPAADPDTDTVMRRVGTAQPPGPTTQTQLDCPTLEALLGLDPFVADGPLAALPSSRFKYAVTYEGSTMRTVDVTSIVKEIRETSRTTFATDVIDVRKGFLSFLGIGPAETRLAKATISLSTSRTTIQEQVETYAAQLFPASSGERMSIDIFWDNVFRTLAFRKKTSIERTAVIGGVLTDLHGHPVAQHLIQLSQADDRYWTHTDETGRYAFHTGTIHPGTLSLDGDGFHQDVHMVSVPHAEAVDLHLMEEVSELVHHS